MRTELRSERRRRSSPSTICSWKSRTKKTPKTLEKSLGYEIPNDDHRWLVSCGNDPELLDRVRPFAGFVRDDDAQNRLPVFPRPDMRDIHPFIRQHLGYLMTIRIIAQDTQC